MKTTFMQTHLNTVVLVSVDFEGAKDLCESVFGTTVENFETDPLFKSVPPEMYSIHSLPSFMMRINEDFLGLDDHFLTFVNTI